MGHLNLLAGAIFGVLILLLAGCGGGEKSENFSRDDAIKIAVDRVEADGVISLENRETVVEDEGDTWHVLFPRSDTGVRGGEPNVFVSKEDGSITDVFYTQ